MKSVLWLNFAVLSWRSARLCGHMMDSAMSDKRSVWINCEACKMVEECNCTVQSAFYLAPSEYISSGYSHTISPLISLSEQLAWFTFTYMFTFCTENAYTGRAYYTVPFSLSLAPQVFSRCLKADFSTVRNNGMRTF